MSHTKERNADEIALTLLVKSLADDEPHCGGWRAEDLRDLTDSDVSLICRIRAVDIDLDVTALIEAKAEGRNPAVLIPALFQSACKAAIFCDVQEKCARREEWDRIEDDERAPYESPESAHAVAHLFR